MRRRPGHCRKQGRGAKFCLSIQRPCTDRHPGIAPARFQAKPSKHRQSIRLDSRRPRAPKHGPVGLIGHGHYLEPGSCRLFRRSGRMGRASAAGSSLPREQKSETMFSFIQLDRIRKRLGIQVQRSVERGGGGDVGRFQGASQPSEPIRVTLWLESHPRHERQRKRSRSWPDP